MATWDTVVFRAGWWPLERGHVIYRGTDGEAARRRQSDFAARLSRWKASYAVYLLKDGRPVGSVVR